MANQGIFGGGGGTGGQARAIATQQAQEQMLLQILSALGGQQQQAGRRGGFPFLGQTTTRPLEEAPEQEVPWQAVGDAFFQSPIPAALAGGILGRSVPSGRGGGPSGPTTTGSPTGGSPAGTPTGVPGQTTGTSPTFPETVPPVGPIPGQTPTTFPEGPDPAEAARRRREEAEAAAREAALDKEIQDAIDAAEAEGTEGEGTEPGTPEVPPTPTTTPGPAEEEDPWDFLEALDELAAQIAEENARKAEGLITDESLEALASGGSGFFAQSMNPIVDFNTISGLGSLYGGGGIGGYLNQAFLPDYGNIGRGTVIIHDPGDEGFKIPTGFGYG